MKKNLLILLSIITLVSCGSVKNLRVEVKNSESIDRSNELVELSVNEIEKQLRGKNAALLVSNEAGEVIPSQVTSDGLLLFPSGLRANESQVFTIRRGEALEYEPKVFGRVFPERKEDFAWENDRLGFRFYGNELKEHDGPSNGLDLWYKRTNKLVLNEWYRKSVEEGISYHVDHGEGCDPYGVGHSLGGGAMAPFVEGELILNDNYLTVEVLDEGPLRFTARLNYPDIEIAGKSYQESRTVMLDAASQMTKIVQDYHTDDKLTLAAGIVKRPNSDDALWESGSDYFIFSEPANEVNGQIHLSILIPQGIDSVEVKSYEYLHPINGRLQNFSHTLAFTQNSGTVSYYTGFGWDKFGFDSAEKWQEYVENFKLALENPFEVNYLK